MMGDENEGLARFLGNYDEEWAEVLKQAAKDTGFNVEVRDYAGGRYPNQVGVVSLWTYESKGTDHRAFHKRACELNADR